MLYSDICAVLCCLTCVVPLSFCIDVMHTHTHTHLPSLCSFKFIEPDIEWRNSDAGSEMLRSTDTFNDKGNDDSTQYPGEEFVCLFVFCLLLSAHNWTAVWLTRSKISHSVIANAPYVHTTPHISCLIFLLLSELFHDCR